MTDWSSPKSPGQRILDVAVFAPLGFLFSIADAAPELARKGRSRIEPQVGMARTVGQLAVRQGFRQFMRMARSKGPTLPWLGSSKPNGAPADSGPPKTSAAPAAGRQRVPGQAPRPRAERTAAASAGERASKLDPADLAIPSYDSLSAPQVVQRLAGLSSDEVAAVREYELVTRGRGTILSRAEQLLG
jgi:hypothetical protein